MVLDRPVRIEIGELELAGVPAGRRFVVAAAFERELARLVATDGIGDDADDTDGREPTTITARPDGNPVLLGVALARAVFERLR